MPTIGLSSRGSRILYGLGFPESRQQKGKPIPITTPTKPRPYGYFLPRAVKYAPPGNLPIQRILASITNKRDLKNTIVLLKDPADPKRPSFLITTLRSHFFPRGSWCAYLYHAPSIYSHDYRLIGSLNLYFEPYQIAPWLTWRFLARQLRQHIDQSRHTRLRQHQGLLIDPDLATIALRCREGGQHNRLGLSEGEDKDPRGFMPTGKALQRTELPLLSPDGGKLSGMRKGWRVLVMAKPYAPANSQASVSSPGIMGGHRGTSTASSDLVAKQDA